MKLRGKILAAFFAALLPLVGIDIWWFYRNLHREEAVARDRLRDEAERGAARLEAMLGVLARIGQRVVRRIPDPAQAQARLEDWRAELQTWRVGVQGLAWVDADGRVLAAAPADMFRRGERLDGWESFRAVQGEQPWALERIPASAERGPGVPLLIRMFDPVSRGAAALYLTAEAFHSLLSVPSVRVRLTDQQGQLVVTIEGAVPSPEPRVPGPALAPELPRSGATATPDEEWLTARASIAPTGWTLTTAIPRRDVMQLSRQTFRKDLTEDTLIFVLCTGIAWLFAHRITRPARRLEEAARAISSGEQGGRVRIEGRDELAAVGTAFNRMADALDASVGTLKRERDAAQLAAEQLAALSRVFTQVSTTLESDWMCEVVVQAATRLLDCKLAFVYLAAESGDTLSFRAAAGAVHPEHRARDVFRSNEGLVGWIFQQREPLVLADVTQDPRTLNRIWFAAEGVRQFAGVPLTIGDSCLGVLGVLRGDERAFTNSDLGHLRALAAHVATTLQNARLYERAEQEEERLRALLETVPVGVLVAEGDPTTLAIRIVLANRACEELLPPAMLGHGTGQRQYEFWRPDGTPLPEEELPLRRAMWRGEIVRNTEIAVRLPDGGQQFFLADAVPFGGTGKARQAVAAYHDITQLKRVEMELGRLAKENAALFQQAASDARVKGLLLEELDHRVRNNLALITSFLELQREAVGGGQIAEVLDDAIARVQGLALTHKVLAGAGYQSNSVQDLLNELVRQILVEGPLADRVEVSVATIPLRLPSKQLTGLGIILNELFTNIVKHAFPQGRAGRVSISGEIVNSHVTITVKDDGVGCPPGLSDQGGHLGFKAIRSIAEVTLGGEFALEAGAGTTAWVRFPNPNMDEASE